MAHLGHQLPAESVAPIVLSLNGGLQWTGLNGIEQKTPAITRIERGLSDGVELL